ncbi:MAG: poly-beta,6-N-acetyl-D-glucosamine N-deacetylase PgaB [Firmicutes bacterium]|nr:poly-beta,6-N-acetyl-D-glucosamine N-deacetylase PgaB [Bacillota bacterium]
MITRRQFLKGCLGAIATISGISILSDYKEIDKLINSIPILLYHRVGSEPDDLTISVKHFQQDMELLSYGGYNTLSLEQVKQHLVDFISYPCGSYKSETLKIAHEAGYLGGFSVQDGFAEFSNPLTIRRIPIFHHDHSIAYVMARKGLLPRIFS